MSVSECSSAEDERRCKIESAAETAAAASAAAASAAASQPKAKKQKRAHQQAPVAQSGAAPPDDSYADLVKMQEIPIGEIPQLKDLSQLLHDCQSLQQRIDGSPLCDVQRHNIESVQPRSSAKRKAAATAAAASAAAAASSSANEAPSSAAASTSSNCENDLEQALQACILVGKPDTRGHWVMDEYQRLLQHLPIPDFYHPQALAGPITQELLQQQLQRRQVVLPTQSAVLESHLLAESGTFVSKTGKEFFFPPCRNGVQCVGMTHTLRLQPRPFVFTMIFFDHEYEYFCRTGQPPNVSRPCVQCSRHHFTASVVFERSERMCGDAISGDTVLPINREGTSIRQFYQNIVDAPGGYARRYMLLSNHTPDDPVLEPLCMPGRSVVFCKLSPSLVNKTTGKPRVMVDQSAIMWTAPSAPQPSIGQNLYSFYRGASKH